MKKTEKPKGIEITTGKFLNKYLQTGIPTIEGIYTCYIDLELEENPKIEIDTVKYTKDGWTHSCWKKIKAWIGPMPVLSSDELNDLTDTPHTQKPPKELKEVKYCVGTPRKAANNIFNAGPFRHLHEAFGIIGENGDYLWENDSKNIDPVFLWNEGWKQVSLKKRRKIIKMVQTIRTKIKTRMRNDQI